MDPPQIKIGSVDIWRAWLAGNWATAGQVWARIFHLASKRQTVTFDELLGEAGCWGWVDTQARRLDEQRYMIRFYRRNAVSNRPDGPRCRAISLALADLRNFPIDLRQPTPRERQLLDQSRPLVCKVEALAFQPCPFGQETVALHLNSRCTW